MERGTTPTAQKKRRLEEGIYRAVDEPGSRCFIPVGAGAADSGRLAVRVVTYNVLADGYLDRPGRIERYANDLTGVAADDVTWVSRLPLMLAELEGYDADVICLQEVEREAFSRDFVPSLGAKGYMGIFAERDTDEAVAAMPEGNRSNGVALFCKTSFKIVASRRVLFAEEIRRLMPEATGDLRGRLDGSLNPNGSNGFNTSGQGVALLGLLRYAVTGQLLVVCSTHLYFDFRFNDVKSAQALMIARALDYFVAAEVGNEATPVVIAGDFNSMPEGFRASKLVEGAKKSTEMEKDPAASGGAYRLFRTGCLEVDHPEHPHAKGSCELKNALKSPITPLISVYASCTGDEPQVTSRDLYYAACLDYIWIGGAGPESTKSNAIPTVNELLEMPYADGTGIAFGPIPNSKYGSDHLAIGATLLLPS